VTVFPEPIGMAAFFHDELLYKIMMLFLMKPVPNTINGWQLGIENKRFLSLSVWTPN